MIRFLKAFREWLFVTHGYLNFKVYTGSPSQVREIAIKQKFTGGKPKLQKCKECGGSFWALKHNPTCRRITCFFVYRMEEHPKYAVTTKHQGIERNHTVHAHSISEVLRAGLPGKVTQISKVK
ncbi:hypothetical protein MUP46_00970 [Patescibacteria group bacterium]|nr:hypothetical protein [Patescibacteria group bacterium]